MATAERQSEHSGEIPNLTASARQSEHNQGFRAVGVAISKLAAPVVVRRGGGVLVRLKSEWPAIIGPDWAAVSWPSALGRDGVLKLLSRLKTNKAPVHLLGVQSHIGPGTNPESQGPNSFGATDQAAWKQFLDDAYWTVELK